MSSNDNRHPLAGIDVDDIVKRSIRGNIQKVIPHQVENSDLISESYVHEPKQFKQVTEFISQKAKNAHVELYKGYIESLNKISSELDTADRSGVNSRHSQFKSLKIDETYNLNAVWLHELYFSNCFDPNSEIAMDSMSFIRLQRDFGTFDDWQRDFMACALAAGNGWAVTGYHTFLRRYVNTVVNDHSSNVMLGLYPVVVVDMWEHAYTRDYAVDKKSYLVSQLRELNWTVIEDRFNRAESLSQVVK
jgi:Fe-Mn family superoxide dismutase